MNCPSCGNEIFPGDPFCDSCGADLRNLQPPPPAAPPVAPVQPEPAPSPAAQGATVIEPPVQVPVQARVQQEAAAPMPVAPQPDVAPASTAAPVAPPQAAATNGSGPRLIVKDTGAVCSLPVGHDVIVGRTDPIDGIFPDVDLTPHDTLTGISRRHATLHEQGGQWFIRDLNSTNYTIVNRQRLQPDQDFLIEPGDEIRFGRLTMVFQI